MSSASSPPMSAMVARAPSTCGSRNRATDAGGQIADVFRRLSSISAGRYQLSAGHHDSGPPAYAAITVQDVRVEHGDAAVGHEAADRAGLIGAMDGVFPAAQGHRRRAHGIARDAARNNVRPRRLVPLDLRGRSPGRLEVAPADTGR